MLRQAFQKIFETHPVETIAAGTGVVMIAIGCGLATQTGWVWLLGLLLCVVGASLTSIAVAWTLGHRESETRVAENLDVLARQLETSISQIHRAVRSGGDTPEQSLSQIAQCIDHLIGISRELGQITGRALPAAISELASTAGARVTSEPPANSLPAKPIAATDGAVAASGAVEAKPPAERQTVTATEPCPACKAPVSFQIGNQPGDSAKPTCEHCGQKFHAHRSSNGVLFVRMPGGANPTKAVSVSCPVCGNRIPANIGEQQQESETRYCFSCGAKVAIDPLTLDCTLIAKRDKLEGRLDPGGVLRCLRCGEATIFLTSNANGSFGICRHDDALVVVPPAGERRTDAA